MFGKLSFSLLLTASLSCFGQVSTYGGYATTSGPAVSSTPVSAANAPLISTPDIALPGSGPAVGAPVNGANDSRVSVGPSIANPNVVMPDASTGSVAMVPVTGNDLTSASLATAGEANSANSEAFEPGIQHFESGAPESRGPELSLAEIASQLRARKHPAPRAFNNDSIAQLHAAGVETGNIGASNSTELAASAVPEPASINSLLPSQSPATRDETLMAQNQAPSLPESDRPSPAPSATAAQQRHPADQGSQGSTGAVADEQPAAAAEAPSHPAKLPQSASPLPLLLLVGALGFGGGAIYLLRR